MTVSECLEERLAELEEVIKDPKSDEEFRDALALYQRMADTYCKAKKNEVEDSEAFEKQEKEKKAAEKREWIKWGVATGITIASTIVVPLVMKSINLEMIRELMLFETKEIVKSNTAKQVVGKIIGDR